MENHRIRLMQACLKSATKIVVASSGASSEGRGELAARIAKDMYENLTKQKWDFTRVI